MDSVASSTIEPKPKQKTYTILPASPADVPFLAAIETAAIQPSPLNSVFFHNWADFHIQRAFFAEQIRQSMHESETWVMKAVREEEADCLREEGGSIEGFVVWRIYEGVAEAVERRGSMQGGEEEEEEKEEVACDEGRQQGGKQTPGMGQRYVYGPLPSSTGADTGGAGMDARQALNADFCALAFRETTALKTRLLPPGKNCACASSISDPFPSFPLLFPSATAWTRLTLFLS